MIEEKSKAVRIFELLQSKGYAMTSPEIANVLGIPVNVVSSRATDLRKGGYLHSTIRPGGKKTLVWAIVPGAKSPKVYSRKRKPSAPQDEPEDIIIGPHHHIHRMQDARHFSRDCIGSRRLHAGIGSCFTGEYSISR